MNIEMLLRLLPSEFRMLYRALAADAEVRAVKDVAAEAVAGMLKDPDYMDLAVSKLLQAHTALQNAQLQASREGTQEASEASGLAHMKVILAQDRLRIAALMHRVMKSPELKDSPALALLKSLARSETE